MSWANVTQGGSESLSLFIPKSLHYSLIGSRGSVVRSIQSEFGVRVYIPRRESTSVEVKVVADSTDAVQSAKEKIDEILGFEASTEPLVCSKFDVNPSFFGDIIGHQGSTLRAKQTEFGVGIMIPRDGSVVWVQGTPEGVANTSAWLSELIGADVAGGEAGDEDDDAKPEFKERVGDAPITEVLFFPDEDGSDGWSIDRFVSLIRSARKSLDICVFTITFDRISNAIIDEFNQGTEVRVITDNDTASALGSDIEKLKDAGIPVVEDKTRFHMHHKFCVIDKTLVMNGSFNWTRSAASKNFENVMVSNEPKFVQQFSDKFEEMWGDYSNFQDA